MKLADIIPGAKTKDAGEVPAVVRGKVKSVLAGFEVKEGPNGERVIRGIASKPTLDRYREVVDREAFIGTLDIYHQNPILLAYHDPRRPIGSVKMELGEAELRFEATIAKGTKDSDEIWNLIDQGTLKAVSIGFREIDHAVDDEEVYHITKLELYELSVVAIPACREALFTVSGGKLVDIEMLPENVEQLDDNAILKEVRRRGLVTSDEGRAVVPYSSYPLVTGAWSGAAARKRLQAWAGGEEFDQVKFRRGFTWYDAEKADTVGAYKLPHHDVRDGSLVTHRGGVIAAMAAVLGSRGGVNIPESDRRAVYNHLARHYRNELKQDPPDYKSGATWFVLEWGDGTCTFCEQETSVLHVATMADEQLYACASCFVPEDSMKSIQEQLDELREAVAEHNERITDTEKFVISELRDKATRLGVESGLQIDEESGLPIVEDDEEQDAA